MKLAVDSDVCINILNGQLSKERFLVHFSEFQICIPAPVIFELKRGLFMMQNAKETRIEHKLKEKEEELDRFINCFHILSFNSSAATISARHYELLKAKGESIGVFDCLIAGTALAHGVHDILTNNIKYFSKINEFQVWNQAQFISNVE